MEIKVFTDVIDALEKISKAVLAIKDIPEKERRRYEATTEEAFSLLDSALMLVQNRLGDLLLIQHDEEISEDKKQKRFIEELASLSHSKDWERIERDVRLCRNLRAAHGDMDKFVLSKMMELSGSDWDNVRSLVDEILEREGELADYISDSLVELASMAPKVRESGAGYEDVRKVVAKTKQTIKDERKRLIKSEIEFIESLRPGRA